MKNLKLTFLFVAMFAVATVAQAQVALGVKAGVNASNFYGSELNNNNAKIGFNAGISADYDFTYNVGIQTGLFATTKGFKYSQSELKYSDNLVYLQLPVHIAYKVDVTPGTRVFLHAGPYAAYGIAGKRSFSAGSFETSSNKVFGSGASQYKAFDAGLGIGAGVELGQLFFDLGWDAGLVNISQASGGNVKNQNAYLSVGFKF